MNLKKFDAVSPLNREDWTEGIIQKFSTDEDEVLISTTINNVDRSFWKYIDEIEKIDYE